MDDFAAGQLGRSIANALDQLRNDGFKDPLRLIVSGGSGSFVGLRIDESRMVAEEFRSGKNDITFPVVIEVFDKVGQHHKLILVDGEEQAQQEMCKGATIQ